MSERREAPERIWVDTGQNSDGGIDYYAKAILTISAHCQTLERLDQLCAKIRAALRKET